MWLKFSAFILGGFLSFVVSAQTGPGGVGTNDGTSSLLLWLDANRGRNGTTPVQSWGDLSGRNITTTINGDPSFVATALNGNGAVRFNSNDDVATSLSINAITYPDITIIAVYVPRIATSGSVWGEDNGQWDRFLTDINLVPTLQASVGAGYDPIDTSHPCTTIDNLFVAGAPTLATVIYDEDFLNGTIVRTNGQTASIFTSTAGDYSTSGYSNFYVGAIGSNGFRFDGDIAEVIVYGSILSVAERLIVENSLAAKYGIAMLDASADLYNEDDLGFDFDVAGIGRVAGSVHNESQGTGGVLISSPTNLGDNEFLLWGHNNVLMTSSNTTDVPTGVDARSQRVWAVSERNLTGGSADVGAINITIDLSGLGNITTSDLRLLVDEDGDGIFAEETPRAGAISLGGGLYRFTAVTGIADNSRFTIATANSSQTALPVELEYFTASITSEEASVDLAWSTLMEKDNLRFDVFRSFDAKSWQKVVTTKGAGTTFSPQHYQFKHYPDQAGRIYYRLSQTDLDGTDNMVSITSVDVKTKPSFVVFPNPTQNFVTFPHGAETDTYAIYNLMGDRFDHLTTSEALPGGLFQIDVSSLPVGQYCLMIGGHSARFLKLDRK